MHAALESPTLNGGALYGIPCNFLHGITGITGSRHNCLNTTYANPLRPPMVSNTHMQKRRRQSCKITSPVNTWTWNLCKKTHFFQKLSDRSGFGATTSPSHQQSEFTYISYVHIFCFCIQTNWSIPGNPLLEFLSFSNVCWV